MTQYNERQAAHVMKYKKGHITRVPLDMQKDKYAELKDFCAANGYAVNTFIKLAIEEKIESMTPKSPRG